LVLILLHRHVHVQIHLPGGLGPGAGHGGLQRARQVEPNALLELLEKFLEFLEVFPSLLLQLPLNVLHLLVLRLLDAQTLIAVDFLLRVFVVPVLEPDAAAIGVRSLIDVPRVRINPRKGVARCPASI